MMNAAIRSAYEAELRAAEAANAGGRSELAFHHLERAHVHVHWLMLRLGAWSGAWREVTGQATRIVAATLFSRIWIPIGNTGRADVSALKPMPIPDDLLSVLESERG
jgi:Protein of unknown function (DUF3703)